MKPISEMSVGELAAFIYSYQLVPKLHLGTEMAAKLSLAVIKGVPKHSLGTRKIYAILHSARQLGYKKRNFFGIDPRMEGSKTIFQPRWQGLPHNLGLS